MTDVMKKYGEMIARLPYSAGEDVRILMKKDGRCYESAEGANLASLTAEDIQDVTDSGSPEIKVMMSLDKVNGMVIFKSPYCGECLEAGQIIEAALDDMAQIVGQKVSVVPYKERRIRNALKHSEAVMVKDKYAITIGRSLYEAYVAMTVLEKSAEVNLKASVIGGPKYIKPLEAKLMRMVYVHKYSKAEKEHKDEYEG